MPSFSSSCHWWSLLHLNDGCPLNEDNDHDEGLTCIIIFMSLQVSVGIHDVMSDFESPSHWQCFSYALGKSFLILAEGRTSRIARGLTKPPTTEFYMLFCERCFYQLVEWIFCLCHSFHRIMEAVAFNPPVDLYTIIGRLLSSSNGRGGGGGACGRRK